MIRASFCSLLALQVVWCPVLCQLGYFLQTSCDLPAPPAGLVRACCCHVDTAGHRDQDSKPTRPIPTDSDQIPAKCFCSDDVVAPSLTGPDDLANDSPLVCRTTCDELHKIKAAVAVLESPVSGWHNILPLSGHQLRHRMSSLLC